MVDDPKQGGEELHHTPEPPQSPIAAREEEVLAFWQANHIFQKSLEKPSPKGEYMFYDGPPFATGLTHHGHLLQSALKDAIPRYRTMRGYHVARQWGWDCHGLPLENQIEQELGIKTKRDIEEFGIERFNTAAKNAVLRYANEWEQIIARFGRWVDMKNDFRTMDATYTESVWWAFKNLYDRNLIYEGFKAMHYCPRCGTTLSNNEVGLGYKDIDDYAVTVKLPLVDEPNTSLLIWTTTPWTLPGNAAAAVNPDALYVKVKVGEEFFIVAKEKLAALEVASQEIIAEYKGKELVGKRYDPPFDYFKDELHKHKTHAFKVYAAPFVTLESGTGIVHIAPAFGADDLELAQKEKIPLIHHVTDEGKFIATVKDFAALPVKPKGRHTETDAKIIERLKEHGLLLNAEKIKHSYPHCWRCDTPLLNWASNSWFVKVSTLKNKLLAQNARVSWVPEHVGTGRFNNLLESAPDWAISRSRFWGAPIPVWRHSKTKELKVMGSVDELLKQVRTSGNHYVVMRHGEAQNNLEGKVDSGERESYDLTQKGKQDVLQTAQQLANKHIDLIITSPLPRTRETAAIMQKAFHLPDSAVMVDERLREIGFGIYSGKQYLEWKSFFANFGERFTKVPEGGEAYTDVRKRLGEFLFEVERRYTNKNVLIVTHEGTSFLLASIAYRWSIQETINKKTDEHFLAKGACIELPFVPYPHNKDYELDLHRPYIDEIPLGDSLSGQWERVKDVFDCWFESGSMPFASKHYPFAPASTFNPKRFLGLLPKGYPADFIAESIDQTRGWFYSLIVLGVGLFGRSPYKAVVTNGLILAEDGRKMSKKLKNYPDPMELVEKFGADALRYYLLSSPVIRGEDLRFSSHGVEEVSKKLLMRLDNVKSFYELYSPPELASQKSSVAPRLFAQQVPEGSHILDAWVISRLNELVRDITKGFESYELDTAARPLGEFIDDLSVWYLRRSRDRIRLEAEEYKEKEDGGALATLHYVLYTLAHLMAPVMPFYAEHLFQAMKGAGEPQSVHLSSWPEVGAIDEQLHKDMTQTRTLASAGLQMREKAGIKLRQPLGLLKAKTLPANIELREVLKEELNVKEVVEDSNLEGEVWLDTTLTPELKEEGTVRTLIRGIQAWRKEQGLTIADRPQFELKVSHDEFEIAKKHRTLIARETGLSELRVVLTEN